MKKEVEILVEVFDKKKKAIKKLSMCKFLGNNKTLDIYIFDPKSNSLKPDKNGQLKNCLRIRSKNRKTYVAYKVDYFDKNCALRNALITSCVFFLLAIICLLASALFSVLLHCPAKVRCRSDVVCCFGGFAMTVPLLISYIIHECLFKINLND